MWGSNATVLLFAGCMDSRYRVVLFWQNQRVSASAKEQGKDLVDAGDRVQVYVIQVVWDAFHVVF